MIYIEKSSYIRALDIILLSSKNLVLLYYVEPPLYSRGHIVKINLVELKVDILEKIRETI